MELATSPAQAERNREIRDSLRILAERASLEVTPREIAAGTLSALLPRGTRIYVPVLPKAEYQDTVEACRLLITDGMKPVPHLPARAIRSASELRDWLTILVEIGVDSLLLIAGDRKKAAGPYKDTLKLLESGLLINSGFRRLGVAGYPEGHPLTDRRALDRALEMKVGYARSTDTEMWMVTQFGFSSGPVIELLRHRRAIGCPLPIHIGIPGPATLKTLVAYSAQCGVSASARVLRRQPSAARLLAGWTPDGLARDLAHHRIMERETPLCGIHVFSFGGVARSAYWLRSLRTPSDASEEERSTAGSPLP